MDIRREREIRPEEFLSLNYVYLIQRIDGSPFIGLPKEPFINSSLR